ncbi:ribonuclease Oy [Strongylocentrotus purpuratus]|uniref:Uncharacterized protein n=1 Tax=Strongylocentrotus purpuratus TaxID=7668 RepID=A0A7M7RE63_STRPU|nr:ribonuclease Oy [Strongylocentrotus purpuratus]|eukprot:XP_780287.3 PREDICTED: ribonuclease Oy [Strongylocentrotus purpuratus]
MNDFQITKMGIRVLVTAIIITLCLLNSRQISAWSVVELVSRLSSPKSPVAKQPSARDVQENAVFTNTRPAPGAAEVDKGKFIFDRLSLNKQSSNDTWTELILTIQWPQSFCLDYNDGRDYKEAGECKVPAGIDDWTIHGLWPSNPGKLGPENCNSTWKFDVTKISDLVAEMNASWPNCITDEAYDSLWSHEWDKHGTCASLLPALYGEHNYFQKTLTLRKQFDIKGMLEASAIVPSKTNSYDYPTIFNAVKGAIGTDPTVTCVYDHKTQLVYLSQVEICLDKQFNPVNCVGLNSMRKSSLGEESCANDKLIFYPLVN